MWNKYVDEKGVLGNWVLDLFKVGVFYLGIGDFKRLLKLGLFWFY